MFSLTQEGEESPIDLIGYFGLQACQRSRITGGGCGTSYSRGGGHPARPSALWLPPHNDCLEAKLHHKRLGRCLQLCS